MEALKAEVRVLQPRRVREPEFIYELKSMNPDAIVVVAYGQILPPDIIHLPQYGCLNIHASLLPLYRGAAPINMALINGDKKTGITIMLMDEGMDTGPILLQKQVDISDDDTAGTLSRKLSETGGDILIRALQGLKTQSLNPFMQPQGATTAPIMKKSDGFIQWTKSAEELDCFIRGMNPWPGAYGFVESERYKILKAVPVEGNGEPGEIVQMSKDDLYIGTGKGVLSVLEIQPSGKPVMPVHAFLQGTRLRKGMKFRLNDD